MPRQTLLAILLGLSITTTGTLASENTADTNLNILNKEANTIAQRFIGSLKPQLKSAIQSGGFTHAIEICSVKAPEIAQSLSQETGWQVKRVSLKPRNSESAAADEWEAAILQQFDQRQQAGEAVKPMAYSEIVTGKNTGATQEFRFMKAQGTGALCLNCHGQQISPEIKQALEAHYPNDMATGYSLGQVRGALSMRKEI